LEFKATHPPSIDSYTNKKFDLGYVNLFKQPWPAVTKPGSEYVDSYDAIFFAVKIKLLP
jgi:hypothetical protein